MDYRIPLYLQLKDTIKQRIEAGEYLPGELIPSERSMSKTYGINRMTVKRAIQELVDEDVLIKKPSVGTFVKEKHTRLLLGIIGNDNNSGISAMVKNIGEKPTSKVLLSKTIDNIGKVREVLELQENETIFALHRIRYSGAQAIAVEYTYLPHKIFDDIHSFDFSKVSLYDYMDLKNQKPIRFKQIFEIIKASKKEANYLKIPLETPIYKFKYVGYAANDQIVEYTTTYIKPENVKFQFEAHKDNQI